MGDGSDDDVDDFEKVRIFRATMLRFLKYLLIVTAKKMMSFNTS